VGLQAKSYSYVTVKDVLPAGQSVLKEEHRAKGIPIATSRAFRHGDYKRQLDSPEENSVTVRRIGQKLHKVYTYEVSYTSFANYPLKVE